MHKEHSIPLSKGIPMDRYLWNITTSSGNVIVYTWNTYHTQWWATVKTPSPLSSPNQQTSGSSRDDWETMILKPCALVYTHPSMALCACGVIIVYTDRVVSFASIQQLWVSCRITLRGHYSTVYSDADQGKHESSTSLAFVWGNHRGPVCFPLMTSSWDAGQCGDHAVESCKMTTELHVSDCPM